MYRSALSSLGQHRLGSVQQLGQQMSSSGAQLREEALQQLWDELNQAVKTRAEVRALTGGRCNRGGDSPGDEL